MKKLDLHTLETLRARLKEPNMRYQSPKGREFEQGENYAFARIDDFLAEAIEQAGGEAAKPKYSDPLIWPKEKPEPEIPWDALPDWVQWVAMDEDGQWWQYQEEPRQAKTVWGESICTRASKAHFIRFTAPDWRTSLRQRPAKDQSPRPESAQNNQL